MTEYAVDPSKRAMTANEFKLAEEYVRAALRCGMRCGARDRAPVFPPGVREW